MTGSDTATRLASCVALVVVLLLGGCGSPVAPPGEESAEGEFDCPAICAVLKGLTMTTSPSTRQGH